MIVVIAEKPSVGRELARLLGARNRHEGYFEGNNYCVTWSFGHLVELEEPEKYNPSLKKWSLDPLPIIPDQFQLKVSSGKGVKEQFNVIKKLFKAAYSIVCATDAGREGELIFRYIFQLCGCAKKPVSRLWISSLTDAAILEGFARLKPLSDYDNLAAAARSRSEADWIVGLNATRGYTVLHSNGRGVLSVGRVQTPVLAMIVNRDLEIANFKPEDYWELWTLYRAVKFKHATDRFKGRVEAESLAEKIGKAPFHVVAIEDTSSSTPPPQLFDLTELQRIMNRLHGLSASQTLKIAQDLYEKKLISYPRTDSRYLSDDLYPQCREILCKLNASYAEKILPLHLEKLSKSKRFFNSAKVTDHHAIIPTGQNTPQLDREEKFVYDAIATRFIAIFYPDCKKAHTTVHGEAGGEKFRAKGTRILEPGWFILYQSEKADRAEDEQLLPAFEKGEQGPHELQIKSCQTKPPNHFNDATLLTAMETAGKSIDNEELKEAMKERGLGTPATRAGIIETLLKREYIRKDKKTLLATEKGIDLIMLLEKQPTLVSAEMTADWEYRLKQIEKGLFKVDDFMSGVRAFTKEIIGKLTTGDSAYLGSCPLCAQPIMKGNTGYGCSAWKTGCPFRFTASQFGTQLDDGDVQTLFARGRLAYPRKLIDAAGRDVRGYITLDRQSGRLGVLTCEEKVSDEAIGACPQCRGCVVEKFKTYSCVDCNFVIWKTIAGKQLTATAVKALITSGKSPLIKGFRSKAGKSFSASLVLKDGKVTFDFSGS